MEVVMENTQKSNVLRLNDHNYVNWKVTMRWVLTKDKTWSTVTSPKPEPVTADWINKNETAMTRLMLSVEENQLVHIRHLEVAADVWTTLQNLYERSTRTSKSFLRRQMWAMRYTSGTLRQHITAMQDMASRVRAAGARIDLDEEISALFFSLPASYDNIVSGLESRDEDTLTMELVVGKLLDEYTRRVESRTSEGNEDAMFAKPWRQPGQAHQGYGKGNTGGGSNSHKGGNSASRSSKTYKSEKECYYCNKKGHFKAECRKRQKDLASSGGKPKEAAGKAVNNRRSDQDGNHSFVIMERASIVSVANTSNEWLVDSGCTSHMTSNRNLFSELKTTKRVVQLAGRDHSIPVTGIGTVRLRCKTPDGTEFNTSLKEVLYVPELESSLISVSKLLSKECKVIFEDKGCNIERGGEVYLHAKERNGLYELQWLGKATQTSGKHERESASVERSNHVTIDDWHRRFGHRDSAAIQLLHRDNLAHGVDLVAGDKPSKNCEVCIIGKLTKKPHLTSTSRAKQPLDLVHTDVAGPMPTATPSGNRWVLTLIDDHSRFTMIYLMQRKDQVTKHIKEYVALTENNFQRRIKVIRSDNGREYVNSELTSYLRQKGIVHQLTVPHTPQQNGRAERKNRSLNEMTKCMLVDAKLHNRFWGEAMCTAAYLQNRLPCRSVGKTPYELWHGTVPDVRHLRVFGSTVYTYVADVKRRKLDNKAIKGVLIGYNTARKGYRILNPATAKVWIADSVRIIESPTKLMSMETTSKQVDISVGEEQPNSRREITDVDFEVETVPDEQQPDTPTATPVNGDEPVQQRRGRGRPRKEQGAPHQVPAEQPQPEGGDEMTQPLPEVRRSNRVNKGQTPERYCMFTEERNTADPKSWEEMCQLPRREQLKWNKAAQEEMKSLEKHKVFELTNLPTGKRAITAKWVFKTKTNEHGEVDTYKARLVARGFSQKYGIEYDETFAPVVRHDTVRILLAYAAAKGQHIRHLDVKSAYLNGDLNEELYLEQPEGFRVHGSEEKVLRLRKSLYGLKQAARAWNQTVTAIFAKIGLQQSKADPCLFSRITHNREKVHVLLYVDDMLVVGGSAQATMRIGKELAKSFEIKDLGAVRHYLGLQVDRNQTGEIFVHQNAKIKALIDEYGLQDAKPVITPMETGFLSNDAPSPALQHDNYRKIVGSLLYLANLTRPDIALAVGILCRRVQAPTEADWKAAKRVLVYLQSTNNQRLHYTKGHDLALSGYVDADWAGDRYDRKSTSGFLFRLGPSVIAWSSRKQTTVALSSSEAEYVAMSHACREAQWIQQLLQDLRIDSGGPVTIYEDNQGCIKMMQSGRYGKRTKHIDVAHHFVKTLLECNEIKVVYCPTKNMLADILTKPLPRNSFCDQREAIGLVGH